MEYLILAIVVFLFAYIWVIDRQSQRIYGILAKGIESQRKQALILVRQTGHIAHRLKRIEATLIPLAEEAKRIIKYQDSSVAAGMIQDLLTGIGGAEVEEIKNEP